MEGKDPQGGGGGGGWSVLPHCCNMRVIPAGGLGMESLFLLTLEAHAPTPCLRPHPHV